MPIRRTKLRAMCLQFGGTFMDKMIDLQEKTNTEAEHTLESKISHNSSLPTYSSCKSQTMLEAEGLGGGSHWANRLKCLSMYNLL